MNNNSNNHPYRDNIQLILASSSPRRKELIKLLDLPFPVSVFSVEVDERIHAGWQPAEAVEQLSLSKAKAVAQVILDGQSTITIDSTDALILAADTVVVLDDDILGKPASPEDAVATLKRLRGRSHYVYTGIVLQQLGTDTQPAAAYAAEKMKQVMPLGDIGQYRILSELQNGLPERMVGHSCSKVTFRPMSDEEILAYVQTAEPLDKAGSYGVQGVGSVFIEKIEGDFYSVMGLPLNMLYRMLLAFGINLFK